jgi:hypothetical protein
MFWKLNPVLQKYFNIEKYIEYVTNINDHSQKNRDTNKLNVHVLPNYLPLIYLNKNPRALDFLLCHEKYITPYILSNSEYIPYMKAALKNKNNNNNIAFNHAYNTDKTMNKLYGSLEELCIKQSLINENICIEDVCALFHIDKNTFLENIVSRGKCIMSKKLGNFGKTGHDGHEGNHENNGNDGNDRNIMETILFNMHTNERLKEYIYKNCKNDECKHFFYNMLVLDIHSIENKTSYTNYFYSHPDFFDICLFLYNEYCTLLYIQPYTILETNHLEHHRINRTLSLSIDTPPRDLHFIVKKFLSITIISCNKINNELIFDYIAKYWDELMEEEILTRTYALNLFSINMNILKYPWLIEKYKNDENWLYCLCKNPYFVHYFERELENGITKSMITIHWLTILRYNHSMFDIISLYAKWLGVSIDTAIQDTPDLKLSFKKIGSTFNVLSNPGWFIEDIDRIVNSKKVFFEELMMKTWSPSRIKKLIYSGIDPDDF